MSGNATDSSIFEKHNFPDRKSSFLGGPNESAALQSGPIIDPPPPDVPLSKNIFGLRLQTQLPARLFESKRFPSSASLESGKTMSPPPPDLPLYLKIFFLLPLRNTTPSASERFPSSAGPLGLPGCEDTAAVIVFLSAILQSAALSS